MTESILAAAVSVAGSKVFHKVADHFAESVWKKIKDVLQQTLSHDLRPEDVSPEAVGRVFDLRPELKTEMQRLLEQSSALRRATLVRSALDKSRVLWIDDHPDNNAWERHALEQFGVSFVLMTSGGAALDFVRHNPVDLIISDIGRDGSDVSGLAALPALRAAAPTTPVIFYVGAVNAGSGVPVGSSGITDHPEELLHLVMDALERDRL